ncbi:MAG: hypothetical protein ACRDOY_01480 [Nocardioidaceae bacterium]
MTETMVLAAALPYRAHRRIERFLFESRTTLRDEVERFLAWLRGPGRDSPPEEQQRRFVAIRVHFNDVLSQVDLFMEVITQRSENGTGVWLSGLDYLAAEALDLSARWFDPPPVVCYLARGPGAAIRRARTRLPGGRLNPVAIVRVPRERMVGHGIASSLVHEVGHQGAALLGLVESLRQEIGERDRRDRGQTPWANWERTISECVADFWSVGKLGIASTLGLLAVVSLPRFFVFRPPGDDPHPMPYVRVLLSAAVGDTLYPHPQWRALADAWRAYYPMRDLPVERRQDIERLEKSLPAMADLMASHQSAALRGHQLADLMPVAERRPEQLLALHKAWGDDIGVLARQSPTLVFAVFGQARAMGEIDSAHESRVLSDVLTAWAVRSSLDVLERNAIPTAFHATGLATQP